MEEISLASKPGGPGGQTYSEEDQVRGVAERVPWGVLEGGSPLAHAPPRGKVGEAPGRGEACEDVPGAYCAGVSVVPSLEGVVPRGPGCACAGAGVDEEGDRVRRGGGGVRDPSGSDWVGEGWAGGSDGGRVRATSRGDRRERDNRTGCWVRSELDETGSRA